MLIGKENANPKIVLRFLNFLRPYWTKGLYASFWMVISVLMQLPLPLLIIYIIDHVLIEKNLHIFNIISISIAAIILFQVVSIMAQAYMLSILRERAILDIQLKLFQHIERLPITFFESQKTGYLVSRIQSDAQAVHGLMADTFLNILKILFLFYLEQSLFLLSIGS